MAEPERGPRDIDTGERVGALGSAVIDAARHMAAGEHETQHGTEQRVEPGQAEALIDGWPEAPSKIARQMLEQYGPPNEATPTKLFWYRSGPWKRIELTSDVVVHDFPARHSDCLTQYIDYRVPLGMFDAIAAFDGSCLPDRTAGEAGARCDLEAANFLTLNLMHDIVTGKTSVEDARRTYAEVLSAYTLGRSAPYAERLQFDVPQGGTEDPDKPNIAGPLAHQAVEKVKDVLSGDRATRPVAARGTGRCRRR